MEDELPETISIFVSWVYTGRIPNSCKIAPEALWILGDRLRSPGFMNEAMHHIFARYHRAGHMYWESLKAEMADYIYENTTSGSKLRKFIVDLVLHTGPLGVKKELEEEDLREPDLQNWRELIRRKGDLVADVALQGSFFQINSGTPPYDTDVQYLYLEDITTRPVEDFVEGKPRLGTKPLKTTR
jgi:hypothetical protein